MIVGERNVSFINHTLSETLNTLATAKQYVVMSWSMVA